MMGIFYFLHALGLFFFFLKKWHFKKMKIESLFNQHSNCLVTLRRFLHSESGSAWHLVTGTPELPSLAGYNYAEISLLK